nr:immunoglobulin light chain junction region [Macaca mulatta]
FLQDTQLPPTF